MAEGSVSSPTFKGIWAAGQACSGTLYDRGNYSPAVDNAKLVNETGQSFWNGDNIYIPKLGTSKIIQASVNGQLIKKTADNWRITCTNVSGVNSFNVTTPDGLKYTFSKLKLIRGKNIKLKINSGVYDSPVKTKSYYIYHAFMLPSKIEDRFGNNVVFSYGASSRVETIASNDGRKITFNYNSNGLISKIYSHTTSTTPESGKAWDYSYADLGNHSTFGKVWGLSQVKRPDGKSWFFANYSLAALYGSHARSFDSSFDSCNMIGLQSGEVIRMTHPEGATGKFFFVEQQHKRSAVPSLRIGPDPWVRPPTDPNQLELVQWDAYSICPTSFSISKKEIVYPGGSASSWLYKYYGILGYKEGESGVGDLDVGRYYNKLGLSNIPYSLSTADLKSTEVTSPDGAKKTYHYSSKYGWTENKLLYVDTYSSNGSLLRRESSVFSPSEQRGVSFVSDDLVSRYASRTTKKSVENFHSNGSTVYEINNNSFDIYDSPLVTELSGPTGTRYIKNEYYHDTTNWVLNLPRKTFLSNDSTFSSPVKETIYNALSMPYQDKLYGQVLKTYAYHSDGNLFKTTFNGSNRYEQFENYYRGKARKITLPCNATNGCNTANGSTANTVVALLEVNADGTTKSVTDFNGNKTSYSYNPIGWLTKIDYADPKWVDKVISYATVATADDGISGSGVAVGSLRQTITQGNFENMVYHDGLLRPVFTRTRDKADAGTISYQRNEYDHENRVTLASFPSSDSANRLGMATEYDALGRAITQTRTSDNAITRTTYLAGNKMAMTDPMNNTTTTTFLAYGQPAYNKPTLIEAPSSDDVAIDYNLYDQITSIRQGNITETRLYDGYQQLCKTVRPETGITAYGYNAQRQPIWRALGTSGSTTSCDATAVPAADKVILAYNNQGVLVSENFPDTTPDETYTYDPNGNLTRLQAGSIVWNYEYNSQNAIDKETLSLDGKSFVLDWEYNSLGAVSSLKYPSGVLIDYAPNALGQSTKAGIYASAVKYHPNGQIKQFTYGNGIVRNVALDTTGRIDAITDSKTAALLSLDPSYDDNDNLARLIDWVDRTNDVDNLSYDGVNRLLTADGRWGTGRYSYDGLGNVLSRSLNNSTVNYQYDGVNRLEKLSGAYAYGYQYDKRGNVTNNGRYVLAYNLGQQMTSAKGIGYLYDGHNRRVRKTENGLHSYSVYSQGGQLLHRVDETGKKTDSIYLGKTIVAEVDN